MIQKRDAWLRPRHSLIPNRPGDRVSEPLFLALGKAVSAWEGVQAATSNLYFAMRIGSGEAERDLGFQVFGGVRLVHKRRKELNEQSLRFLTQDFGEKSERVADFRSTLQDTLAAYVGWAERRNDIAHGYVTEMQGPDYEDTELRIITTYALCPSHTRIARWPHGEPVYNYVATNLESFADGFRQLDDQFESLASTADWLSNRDDWISRL